MHGVGHEFVQSAFKAFDFKPPLAVPEQKDPDPEFPTVKYPNPEEGKGVLVNIVFKYLLSILKVFSPPARNCHCKPRYNVFIK